MANDETRDGEKPSITDLLAVWNPRLKVHYFIPHLPQKFEDASPFGMYTPGIHESAGLMMAASSMPGDVREPFTSWETVLDLRLRRLLWRYIIPVELPTLVAIAKHEMEIPFRVVLTGNDEVARGVDELEFVDGVPFLHVSTNPGVGRIRLEDFSVDSLLTFVTSVVTYLADNGDASLSTMLGEALKGERTRRQPTQLASAAHNVTAPNEIALMSFGYDIESEDPLVSRGKPPPQRGDYVARICRAADAVASVRAALCDAWPALGDYALIVSAPSVHWSFYSRWRDVVDGAKPELKEGLQAALTSLVRQRTYFHVVEEGDTLPDNRAFGSITYLHSRDQRCYTAGLSLLASSTLAPVVRLEPNLNDLRGDLRTLALCARTHAPPRAQWKQSRLARQLGRRMRALIDPEFLQRIDATSATLIEGVKIVSDLPLEWLPTRGLPLGLRCDLSRATVLPGNLFITQCISPPVFPSAQTLRKVLVIRSFDSRDVLKPILETAIRSIAEANEEMDIRFVDVATPAQFVSALQHSDAAILIFDGHGAYENHYGVGTLVIGGEPVDVWSLRNECRVPPIVLFSACDTHPIDGSHGSVANAALMLGARTVLGTSLPIHGVLAARFIARLMLRIAQFVPWSVDNRELVTWREVISGMLRMTYTTEVTRILMRHAGLRLSAVASDRVHYAANVAINARRAGWFETYTQALAAESGESPVQVVELIERWASMTDAMKYVQLGAPENVVILPSEMAKELLTVETELRGTA